MSGTSENKGDELSQFGVLPEKQAELLKEYPKITGEIINRLKKGDKIIQEGLSAFVDAGASVYDMITALGNEYNKPDGVCHKNENYDIDYIIDNIFGDIFSKTCNISLRAGLNKAGYSFSQQMEDLVREPIKDHIILGNHEILLEFIKRGISIEDFRKVNGKIAEELLYIGWQNYDSDIDNCPAIILDNNGLPLSSQLNMLSEPQMHDAFKTMLDNPKAAVELKDKLGISFSQQLSEISSYEQIGSSTYYWPLEYSQTSDDFYAKHEGEITSNSAQIRGFQAIIDEGLSKKLNAYEVEQGDDGKGWKGRVSNISARHSRIKKSGIEQGEGFQRS